MEQMNWRTEMASVNRGKIMKEKKQMKPINLKKTMKLLEDAIEMNRLADMNSEYLSRTKLVEEQTQRAAELMEQFESEVAVLKEAIKSAEGRATERTISYMDIIHKLDDIFGEIGIPKSAMEGVSVSVDIHAQHFPNAYKYAPMSTQFQAVYKRGGWVITDIRRNYCGRSASKKVHVTHTDASKAAIINRLTVF